jgi:hypothetical protein
VRGLRIFALVCAVSGCGRTALEPYQQNASDAGGTDHPRDLPADKMDAPRDMAPDLPVERAPDLPPPPPDAPVCVPTTETCNGVDDDCDGMIDDNLPAIPCPNGGARVCVGGHYSDCPRRCQVCVPGSKRTCITSFCTFWGNQECASDGMSFGPCKEAPPPPECAEVASQMQRSPALEDCCIKHNFCCVDEFDLDNDGDRTEMLGRCESIVCE